MMISKLLRYAFVCALIILGVKNVSAQEVDVYQVSNENDLAQCERIQYWGDGEVKGAGKIFMQIIMIDGVPDGRYYYVKSSSKKESWIELVGSKKGNVMTLREKGKSSKNGYFKGTFKGGVYKGTFYRNDGKKFAFSVDLL